MPGRRGGRGAVGEGHPGRDQGGVWQERQGVSDAWLLSLS